MFSLLLAYLATFVLDSEICCKDDKYAIIIDRVCREHLKATPSSIVQDSLATTYQSSITPNGTWTDINYESVSMTEWSPITHLERLLILSTVYLSPESRYYASDTVFRHIVLGLQWWDANRSTSKNWWYQWVGVPQHVGLLLTLMRHGENPIPPELENNLLKNMEETAGDPEEAGSKGSAANKIDVSVHWIYRGALTRNNEVLAKGFRNIFQPISFTTGEGIQNDFSYLQHGPQLYIGGYGEVVVEKVAWAASIAKDTEYRLPKDKLNILSHFLLDAYLPSICGRKILGNVSGRQIARKGALDKTSILPTLERMKRLDPSNRDIYEKAIQGIGRRYAGPYGNSTPYRHYWRADYSLSSTTSGQFDVRMSSTRTYRSENGNGENMLGYFLSDGATFITIDGNEYDDIYPSWDWSAIPGTTTPHLPASQIPIPHEWGTFGTSTFVGGVQGCMCGLTAYEYVDTNTVFKIRADKSWFFCRNEVVCLGSGVSCTSDYPSMTTVNQTLSKGPIYYGTTGITDTLTDSHLRGKPLNWVWHNKVGYYFPWDIPVELSDAEKSGNWVDINRNTHPESVTNRIFSITIPHGIHPSSAKYAYIVVRDTSCEQMKNYEGGTLRILQADDKLHVICDTLSGCWGFAFFKAGRYTSSDLDIRVEAPCLILLERNPDSGTYVMQISSPSQNRAEIGVEIAIAGLGKERITAEFPVNDKRYAGMTQSYELFK